MITNKLNFLTSNNFARKSNVVFSEVISVNEYELLDKKNLQIISKQQNQVSYILKNIQLKENDVIFCNTDFVSFLFEILKNIKLKNIKLVTHWSDLPITEDLFNKKPQCISEWYSPHIDYDHENLFSIPLGLSGDYSPKNLLIKDFLDFYKNPKRVKKNLLYLNFQKNTNLNSRDKLLNEYSKKEWVTHDEPTLSLNDYISQLSLSNFVLCPFGNGFDTHRVWETLYAGSYPVVLNHTSFMCTEDLPVLKVNSFEVLSQDLLIKTYNKFLKDTYKLEKLDIDFWFKIINNNLIESEKTVQIKLSNLKLRKLIIKNFISKKSKRIVKKITFRFRQVLKLLSGLYFK